MQREELNTVRKGQWSGHSEAWWSVLLWGCGAVEAGDKSLPNFEPPSVLVCGGCGVE